MSVKPSTSKPENEALLAENRAFSPAPDLAAHANARADPYDAAERDLGGRTLGDTTTLTDSAVDDAIRENSGKAEED